MRIVNRVLALLAAIALIVFAVLFTIEVIAAVFAVSPVIVHWHQAFTDGRHNIWGNAGPRVTSSLLAAAGAILVLAQLKPRRATRFPLEKSEAGVDAAMSRRGIRHALNAAALGVDGVTKATSKVRRGGAAVKVRVIGGGKDVAAAIRTEVDTAVGDRVSDLALRHRFRARVKMRAGKVNE